MRAVIEKITSGGWGLARTSEGVLFSGGVLPGETIEVIKAERSKGILWALEFNLLEKSPERIEPECPYFKYCGGCDFQHTSYETERRLKCDATKELFDRLCSDASRELSLEWRTGAEMPTSGYRNTIRIQGGGGYLGYCRKHSREIVDIEDCLIAAALIRADIPRYKKIARSKTLRSVSWRAGSDPATGAPALTVVSTARGETNIEGGALRLEMSGRRFTVSPHSFFQVNVAAAERIVAYLRENLEPSKRLVDLFAGVGVFAILLRDRFDEAVGMEISRDAVKDFRTNAANAAIVIEEWDAARGLKSALERGDTVLIDPPRTGLPEKLAADLIAGNAQTIAYVSCDPATFARDLTALRAGGYEIVGSVNLFDMFARTSHVELAAVLRR